MEKSSIAGVRILLVLSLLCVCAGVFSQNKKVFADEKTIQISAARIKLKDAVINNNIPVVKQMRDSIKQKAEDDMHLAFFPGEYWLLCFLTKDYSNILADKYLNDLNSYNAQGIEMPVLDDLGEAVRTVSFNNSKQLLAGIEGANLPAREKELLNIVFLFSVRGKIDSKDTIQTKLNELGKTYVAGNSSAAATPFINTYVIQEFVGTGRAHELSLGAGYMMPYGGLSDYFGSALNIGLDVKEYFNWFIVGLTANLSNGRLSSDLDFKGKTLGKDSVYTSYYLGVDLGARLYENHITNVNVFAGAGASDISVVSNEELNGANIKEQTYVNLNNKIALHAGLTVDLKFLKMGKKAQFKTYSDFNHSNFFRLKYDYMLPFYKNEDSRLDGGFHTITLQIGFNTKTIKKLQNVAN